MRWLDCSSRSQLAAATVHRRPPACIHWTSGPLYFRTTRPRRPQRPGGRRDSLGSCACEANAPGAQPDTAAWAAAPGDDPCVFCIACREAPSNTCIVGNATWAGMWFNHSVGRSLPPTTADLESPSAFCKNFQDFSSHRIFGRMHETLNINKK